MFSKNNVYYLAENTLPPFIFRAFKKSFIYRYIVNFLKSFSNAKNTAEVFSVTEGHLAGYKMKFDPTGVWQQEMLTDNYDRVLLDYLDTIDTTGMVIYDIGAHIGYHSLIFDKYVGDNGHIYAFEPNPVNATRLSEIVSLNKSLINNITVITEALSDQVGETTFLSSDNIENGTSSGGFVDDATPLWDKNVYTEKTGFTLSKVNLNTVDNLIEIGKIKPPDLLKIDVEGAEQLVLAGAANTLKNKPLIVVEFHSILATYECMATLSDLNYKTKVLKQEEDGRVMIIAQVEKN